MKPLYYLILVLAAICSGIGTSFGQYPEHMPHAMMSLYTDKQNYGYNDTVTISGDMDKNYFKSLSWLDVEIRDPSGVIFKNDIIPINNTGHYTYRLKISQNFTSGQYLIRVSNPYYPEADLGNSFYVNVGNQIMPKNEFGDGNVFNMQASDFGLPGDIIEIKGNLVTKDSIKIMLHDPDGNTRYSATTFADRNGEFASQLKVPSDAVSGLWKIVGNSGIYHRELNFTVSGYSSSQTCYGFHCTQSNSSGTTTTWPSIHGNNSSTLQPPLKQSYSGITSKDVMCKGDLHLVVKSEDGSPACVRDASVGRLVRQGWWAWNDKVGNTVVNTPDKRDYDKSCGMTDTMSSIIGTTGFVKDTLPPDGITYPGMNLTESAGTGIQFAIKPDSIAQITFAYDFNPYPGDICKVTSKDVIANTNPAKPDISISDLLSSPDILEVDKTRIRTDIPPLGDSGDVQVKLINAEDLNDHVVKVTYQIISKPTSQIDKSYFVGFWWHSAVGITVGNNLYNGTAFSGPRFS